MSIAPAQPVTGISRVAWWPMMAVSSGLAALFIAVSTRHSFHRDELYFPPAGQHLAWGYPDRPPLTPALTRLVSAIAPDSLIALRLPSALPAGGVVLLRPGVRRWSR